jgi:prepilin-type N-terminal cleavage/methylation domain-containing protein
MRAFRTAFSRSRSLLRLRRGDDGFTLIETMAALVIAGIVFSGLAGTTIAALRGTLVARQNQMASDMAVQALEKLRAADFVNLAHSTIDSTIGSDARISGGKFNPGTGTAETLVYLPDGVGGSVNPHTTVESKSSVDYRISRYVTVPNGYGTGSRRVTVVVEWTVKGATRTQQQSTIVTETRRGLPLPRFLFSSTTATSLNKGVSTVVDFGFKLHNYGARDTWNLTSPSGPSGSSWTYFFDNNGDGVLGALDTTQLTDTDGDGVVDTGPVEVNRDVYFIAQTTAPSTLTTWNGTLTVRSSAQPSATTASATSALTITTSGTPSPLPSPTPTSPSASPTSTPTPPAQSPFPVPVASCATTPCSLVPIWWLHELPLGSHTTSGSAATLDTNQTMQTSANNYSVGKPGAYGRWITPGGVLATESSLDKVADWRYQAPSKLNFGAGQAVATIYVGCLSGSGPMTLTVGVGTAGTRTLTDFNSVGSGSATLTTCDSTFRPLTVPITIASGYSVTKNKFLVLRAVLPSSNTTDVRIAYDWAAAPSSLVLPQ